jgi:tRNA pseudouridine55 synthase
MFHVLNINKPPGPTSRDVVNRVKHLVKPDRAGHAGTLDPIASGVLLVCVGKATGLIEYAQALPKSYRGTFLLGHRSETGDIETEVTPVESALPPTGDQLTAALPNFTGSISQRPPRYSAVKIAGRRAYELARQGVEFEPAAKTVEIHRLSVVRYAYPELVLDVVCGSGTYIRALGRDLAAAVGTIAVMTALERTAVGPFTLDSAIRFDDVNAAWQDHLLPPAQLMGSLPRVTITAAQLTDVRHGRDIAAPPETLQLAADVRIAAFDALGDLVAILRRHGPGVLSAARNFARAE